MGYEEGFDDDADGEYRPPLPPADRVWRHPTEVAAELAAHDQRSGPNPWAVGFVSVIGGVLLAGSLMFAMGGIGDEPSRLTLEPVATLAPRTTEPEPIAAVGASGPSDEPPYVVSIDVAGTDGVDTGHGMVVDEQGYILTTAHLVEGATDIRVLLADGSVHDATVVGTDPVNDLAVVAIDQGDLPLVRFDDESPPTVGEPVRVVGGSRGARGPTWSGSVASLDERVSIAACDLHAAIGIDADLDATATGSAVLDEQGRVVGMATTIGGADDGAVAIPVRTLAVATPQLVRSGEVEHGWLGVEVLDASEEQAAAAGVPGAARVQRVIEDSPAETAGLEPGDLVIALDAESVTTMGELVMGVREQGPDSAVRITVARDGQTLELDAVLGEG